MRLDEDRLLDILEAIEAIERYTVDGKGEFDRNELVRVWCLRHIEIVGEAAARISPEAQAKAADIPWKQIVGMRNTLVHAYFDVDWNEVWNVVAKDLQPLRQAVKRLLATFDAGKTT